MIFKRAQTEIPRGKFAVPPRDDFNKEFANKFADEYHKRKDRRGGHYPYESILPAARSTSLVMHHDGSVDQLPYHHDDYFGDTFDDYIDSNSNSTDQFFSLGESASRLIHNVFGGIRIYAHASGDAAFTAYQMPTKIQLEALDKIVNQNNINFVEFHVYLALNGGNVQRFIRGSWDHVKRDLMQIEANESINEDAKRRVDFINQLRDPGVDFAKPRANVRDFKEPVKKTDFNVNDVIDSIKDTPIKTPSSLRYTGGFSVMDFIKKADELMADFDENKYTSTGDFKKEKPENFDYEYSNEFRNFFHNHPLNEKIDHADFGNIVFDSSLIIYNDGTIDQLSDHHRDHLSEISDQMASMTGKNDVFRDYPDTLGYGGTYEMIHHVLGGCRGYLVQYSSDEYALSLATYQFPTYEQMKTIDNLNSKYKFQRVEVDLYYRYNDSNHYVNKNGSWDTVKAEILQLKSKLKSGLSHSDSNLHNLIKKFRSDEDQFYDRSNFSPTVSRPKRNPFNVKDVINRIKEAPIKTPSSLRYTGGFSVMDLIRLGGKHQSPKSE